MHRYNHSSYRQEEKEIYPDTSKACVRTLLDVIAGHGVEEIVCSPGSRNSPLLIAASARVNLKKTVVIDERSAAFIALGKSLVSKLPVAVVCTSGTALLNYGPALAEAYYQGVPLIIISADRPMEWIDQDDSQTIRQQDVFRNFIKKSYDIISGRDDNSFLWFVNRIANEGMMIALSGKRGPVHFNIRLSDPLGQTEKIDTKKERIINLVSSDTLSNRTINGLASSVAGKKILLIAGFHEPDADLNKSILKFSRLPNVAIMAETISNLHIPIENYSIDSSISRWRKKEKEIFRPDILISIGGALISRMLKEWLRDFPPEEHWSIGEADIAVDCFQCLTRKIDTKASSFLNSFANALIYRNRKTDLAPEVASYKEIMERDRRVNIKNLNERISVLPWTDLTAYSIILKNIPPGVNLFLSNGTTIRYAQIITHQLPHAEYCNRGVSGIDGSTSTAIGGMTAYNRMTVLLTGDMSFAYDLGALGTKLADHRMRIIVINNGGGGIFRFIKTTSTLPQREEYFCVDPDCPVKGLAEAYGWEYYKADGEEILKDILKNFFENKSHPAILEVTTPGELSGKVLKEVLFSE